MWPRELPFRVAFSFACFGGIISLVLCIWVYFAVQEIGMRIIDRNLIDEMDDFIARRTRNPASTPLKTTTLMGFVHPAGQTDPSIPPPLLTLQPGIHDIDIDHASYRVLVKKTKNINFFILYNNTLLYERWKLHFLFILIMSSLGMTAIASLGGYVLTGWVIAPLKDLAREVNAMTEIAPGKNLSRHFSRDALGELAKVLAHRQDQLLNLIERERAFATDVSHELRNPLAIIQGVVEILQNDHASADAISSPIQRLARAVSDINILTSALLLLARADGNKTPSHAVCLISEIIDKVLERNQFRLKGKSAKLRVQIDAQPQLNAESVFVQIVIGNLIRNAFNFIHHGEVHIHLEEERLTITDTGVGMDPHVLEKIFQKPFKGTASQGSGVGLTLVKRICDHHGWRVTIQSQANQGTVAQFLFRPQALDDRLPPL
ncbi:MAG: HAMP domain-containing histidine kinase [Magnetococcus sp. THC-1_WYH]